ncbi:MAG: ComEC/Rec2 family competence protein [Atribacterota bacterium]
MNTIKIINKPAPLFLFFAAVVVGIFAGELLNLSSIYFYLIPGIFFLFAGIAAVYFDIFKKISYLFFLVSVVLFSGLNYTVQKRPSKKDISNLVPFNGIVKGRVLTSSRAIVVKVKSVEIQRGQKIKCRGRVYIHSDSHPPPYSLVKIKGYFQKPSTPLNPGQFKWKKYLSLKRIFTETYPDYITVIDNNILSTCLSSVSRYINSRIDKFFDREKAGILKGILLGRPGLVSGSVIEQFRKTGIMHLLAVSGLHVGLIFFVFFFTFSCLSIDKKISMYFALAFVYFYVLLVGIRPSALRAAVMLTMVLGGYILGGRGNVFNSISLAGILILVFQPGLLFTAEFLLSFAAVWGIIYLTPSIRKYTGEPLAVSCSACAGIAPILVWNYNYLPILAPIVNLAVVPLAGIIVFLGITFLVFSGISSFMAEIYSASLGFLIDIVEYISGFIHGAGAGGMVLPRPGVFLISGFYIILAGMGLKKKKFVMIFGVLLIVFSIIGQKFLNKNEYFCFIKGFNSSCCFVKAENKDTALFVGRQDIDYKPIRDFLYSKGIKKVKYIFFIHPPFGKMFNTAMIANQFKAEQIFYPRMWGSEFNKQEFKKSIINSRLEKAENKKIKFGKGKLEIFLSRENHTDIRDYWMNIKISGKKNIFIYSGGAFPRQSFWIAACLEPYNINWNLIKRSGSEIYLCSEMQKMPKWVSRIKKGKIFYF